VGAYAHAREGAHVLAAVGREARSRVSDHKSHFRRRRGDLVDRGDRARQERGGDESAVIRLEEKNPLLHEGGEHDVVVFLLLLIVVDLAEKDLGSESVCWAARGPGPGRAGPRACRRRRRANMSEKYECQGPAEVVLGAVFPQ